MPRARTAVIMIEIRAADSSQIPTYPIMMIGTVVMMKTVREGLS
jgi:hypothetical protein